MSTTHTDATTTTQTTAPLVYPCPDFCPECDEVRDFDEVEVVVGLSDDPADCGSFYAIGCTHCGYSSVTELPS